MSDPGTAASDRQGGASGGGRAARAWRNLSHEQRLAAYAAVGLFLTLFLPWYQETVIARTVGSALVAKSVTISGWGAFAFVEIAVLLIAVSVLVVLFQRAEGRGLHVPGGDGVLVLAAGSLASVLVLWGIVDKQGTSGHGQYVTTSGVEWGIFIALAVAVLLAYAGSRMRTVYVPPPRAGDDGVPFWGPAPSRPDPPESPPRARSESPPRARSESPSRARSESPPRARPESPPAPPADEATRVSSRRPGPSDGPPTRVSEHGRRGAAIGPRVVPDDPPTMSLDGPTRVRADEQLTMPLEDDETK